MTTSTSFARVAFDKLYWKRQRSWASAESHTAHARHRFAASSFAVHQHWRSLKASLQGL